MSAFSNLSFLYNSSNKSSSKYFEKRKSIFEPPKLKSGYISSQTPLGGFGPALASTPSRKSTKYNPKIGNRSSTIPGLYIYEDPKIALQNQQRAYSQQLQATASRTQADIAKQLKIIQNEKSAVAKLSADYSKMLKDEADRRVKAQEEAKIAAATTAANQSRQGQTNNVQVQPASQTPRTGGTKIFKKRGISQQFMSGISGMVNI